MAYSFNPSIATNGLILCHDFANVKCYAGSGTAVTDLARLNNGTITGGASVVANACVLDGINDIITTSLVLPSPVTTPTTFEIVFKNNSNSANKGLMGRSAYLTDGFAVGFASLTTLRYTIMAAGSAVQPEHAYDSSVMSCLTCVFSGRGVSTYRNGVFVATSTAAFDPLNSPSPIHIGANGQGGWTTAQVDISIVRVYNRALSSFEVLQNYKATKGRYGL